MKSTLRQGRESLTKKPFGENTTISSANSQKFISNSLRIALLQKTKMNLESKFLEHTLITLEAVLSKTLLLHSLLVATHKPMFQISQTPK